MAEIWQIIVQSNTLNFFIVVLILSVIVYLLNFKQKIDDIKDDITNYVEESSNEKKLSEKELERVNTKLKRLPDVIERINKSAKNSVENMGKKIEAEIKDKMLDIDNNAKRIMSLETKKFKSKLSSNLSEMSINLAKTNAVKQLENNRELHDKYIYDAINEIDGIDLL